MEQGSARQGGRIVVGVDGSAPSREALEWAAQQARQSGGAVTAVATWSLPTSYGWAPPVAEGFDFASDTKAMLESVVAETATAHPGVVITAEVREGHPAAVLTELSRDASMLVVGSRGHGEVAGMLLGSVSQHVAAHAHCPVVIVRGP